MSSNAFICLDLKIPLQRFSPPCHDQALCSAPASDDAQFCDAGNGRQSWTVWTTTSMICRSSSALRGCSRFTRPTACMHITCWRRSAAPRRLSPWCTSVCCSASRSVKVLHALLREMPARTTPGGLRNREDPVLDCIHNVLASRMGGWIFSKAFRWRLCCLSCDCFLRRMAQHLHNSSLLILHPAKLFGHSDKCVVPGCWMPGWCGFPAGAPNDRAPPVCPSDEGR